MRAKEILNNQQSVAEDSRNNNVIAQKIFFARSKIAPKAWSYDHVGFITQDGKQIQMSGHKGNDVYITNDVTDDPEFSQQQIKVVSLPKPVTVPTTNSVGAENCGTFVANVLQANGVKGFDTEKLYRVFKKPKQQGVAEAWSEKYKKSINCKNPKGFSQRAHCQGRKKNNEQVELDERKRKRKKKTARYYYGPAYYFGATDTGAEGGDGGGLEEDWKKSLANVGLASAIGLGAAGGIALKDKVKSAFTEPTPQTTQPVQAKSQQVQVSPITNNPLETYLMNVAKKSGLTGIELAQFLGQCAHETMDYKRMIERGAKKYFNKYEPKFAPGKAKLLGNVKSGDGERYKGRGYIQLTGRYNYKAAGEALNLPLEQNPDLAAQPDIAAKIALWYWGQRVKPEVQNFADTTSVTRKINPGLSGLEDRHENFLSYIAQR